MTLKPSSGLPAAAVWICATLACTQVPAADYAVSGQTRAWAGALGESPDHSGLDSLFDTQPIQMSMQSVANAAGAAYGEGTTWASAGTGGVHASAIGHSNVAGAPGGAISYGSGRAHAQYADFFTLDVPGYAAGTMFTMTVPIRIDASQSYLGNSSPFGAFHEAVSSWEASASLFQWVTGGQQVSLSERGSCAVNVYGTGCTGSTPDTRLLHFSMPNRSWQALVSLTVAAIASGYAYDSYGGSAFATGISNLSHTVAWGGIAELRDPNGLLVTDFSAPSASNGFDYRYAYVTAVPEAPASALLALGLGTLWARRRLAAAGERPQEAYA